MKRHFFLLLLFLVSLRGYAQQSFYKGLFENRENAVKLVIDLSGETVTVPGFSFLGKTNGYMGGNIHGVWIVTRCSVMGTNATIHLSNEFGSESQTVNLSKLSDSTFLYEVKGSPVIKKVVNKKLVKIPTKMVFGKSINKNL